MSNENGTPVNSRLQEFFVTGLKEIYWSEVNLVNVLNSMNEAATSPELKDAFAMHATETRDHVQRVEEAFALLGLMPDVRPSKGLQGLFDEGWQVIDDSEQGSAQRDVALIIAAQKVEHYEIACYGSLITLAQTLELTEIAQLLKTTLGQEKETDEKLTTIAQAGLNKQAAREPLEA